MIVYLFVGLFWAQALAQYYPPEPEGLTVLESNLRPGVTISYKQVSSMDTAVESPFIFLTFCRRISARQPLV